MSRDSFDNQLKRLGHNIVDGVVVGIGLIDTAALRAFMLHPMELPPHILKAIVDEAFGPEGETAGSSE